MMRVTKMNESGSEVGWLGRSFNEPRSMHQPKEGAQQLAKGEGED